LPPRSLRRSRRLSCLSRQTRELIVSRDKHVGSPLALFYGVQPIANRRRVLRRAVAAAAIATAIVAVLPTGYRLYDTSNMRGVERVLRSAPNERSVEFDCYHRDELSPAMVLFAGVHLDVAGSKVIWFRHPKGSELSNGDHLRLSVVGPINLYRHCEGNTIDDYVDAGRDGEFAGMLPFEVRNVGDLTSHYDELERFLKSLPPTAKYTAKDGKVYEFCNQ
jgi:hypothetical protein